MLDTLRSLLQLQTLDDRLRVLEHDLAALAPELGGKRQALEKEKLALDASKAEFAAQEKERRQLEGQIPVHLNKIAKLEEQYKTAANQAQADAFQHELSFQKNAVAQAEERVFALMESAEIRDPAIKAQAAAVVEHEKQLAEATVVAKAKALELQKQIAEAKSQRAATAAQTPAAIVSRYDHIRGRYKDGQGITEVSSQGQCRGCRATLPSILFQKIKAADELYTCETCGRYLYYNPPQDVYVA